MSTHSNNAPTSWSGRLTDGQTARSSIVDVRLSARGLEMLEMPPARHRLVAYADLATTSPITSSSKDTLISIKDRPGATLFVEGQDFVRLLGNHAPHLTNSAQRWRILKPLLAAFAAFVGLAAVLWSLDVSPAKTIASMMPDKVRQSLGDSVVTSMVGSHKECRQAAGRAALDKLVVRLSQASDSPRQFSVRVVDWKLLNAIATPGERIVLTSQIINRAGSPDEIAGILAHEMGHGIELHPEAGLVRAIGIAAALEFMVGGGNLANIGFYLAQVQYTRAAEREADRHALRILKEAGISHDGLVAFFIRLAAKEGSNEASTAAALLRTHPFSRERAKIAAAQEKYSSTPALSAAEWQALRAICES